MLFNYYKENNFKNKKKKIIINDNSNQEILLEFLYNLHNIPTKNKFQFYISQIDLLITNEWGKFPPDFIQKHIGNAKEIILAWNNEELVAFTAMSHKKICNKLVHYIEFSVTKKQYQNKSLFQKLNYFLIKEALIKNLIFNKSLSIELMFISPNIRTLTTLVKYVSFIYPNPSFYNRITKSLPEADELTWKMANELIQKSENPNRKIEREGCVLIGSYTRTPWLIHGIIKQLDIPYHHKNLFNEFAEKYLRYKEKADREFIIRARINLIDLIKFFINSYCIFKNKK